jgi:hypothetical protein
MVEMRDVYSVLVGKPEGKRPLGRPRCGWEDNVLVDLQEGGVVAWTGLIWLRIGIVGWRLCCNEPSGSIKM